MKACFMYLASSPLVKPLSDLSDETNILSKIKDKFQDPFTYYAVYEWPTHAKRLESSDLSCSSIEFLTGGPDGSFAGWRELWELEDIRAFKWWEADTQGYREGMILWSERIVRELRSPRSGYGTPLYYATTFGLRSVVHQLLTQGQNPNDFGGPGAYPLFVALENGDIDIAELLNIKRR